MKRVQKPLAERKPRFSLRSDQPPSGFSALINAAAGRTGRLFLWQCRRFADQAGFAGRLVTLTWQGRRSRRRTLLCRLVLDEVFKLARDSMLLVLLVGSMLGFLWSFLWFGTLSNIGGVENISSFLINIHTVQIAPIMTTVIAILRYGGPTTWELAVMKSGRQFETLVRQGIPPEHYLAAPRIIAAFLAMPVLLAAFTLASFVGASYFSWRLGGQPAMEFVLSLGSQTGGHHFLIMALKSVVIALSVSFFCVYNGFSIEVGSLDQGRAVMRRAMGESFFYGIFLSVLVSVVYS